MDVKDELFETRKLVPLDVWIRQFSRAISEMEGSLNGAKLGERSLNI